MGLKEESSSAFVRCIFFLLFLFFQFSYFEDSIEELSDFAFVAYALSFAFEVTNMLENHTLFVIALSQKGFKFRDYEFQRDNDITAFASSRTAK